MYLYEMVDAICISARKLKFEFFVFSFCSFFFSKTLRTYEHKRKRWKIKKRKKFIFTSDIFFFLFSQNSCKKKVFFSCFCEKCFQERNMDPVFIKNAKKRVFWSIFCWCSGATYEGGGKTAISRTHPWICWCTGAPYGGKKIRFFPIFVKKYFQERNMDPFFIKNTKKGEKTRFFVHFLLMLRSDVYGGATTYAFVDAPERHMEVKTSSP